MAGQHRLRIGALNPIGELTPNNAISGVQQRLKDLGFNCGTVDDISGSILQQALREFQRTYRLTKGENLAVVFNIIAKTPSQVAACT